MHDHFSSMPDEVLSHILSFLEIEEAVQTCILSKRWRHVWKSVPVLKFDLVKFWTAANPGVDNEEEKIECEDKFNRFVNDVLDNRGASRLDMFEYYWFNEDGEYRFYDTSLDWLDRAAVLMPRVIRVQIVSSNPLDVPDSVLSCASLQELSLGIQNSDDEKIIIRSELINLPSLKFLELSDVDIGGDLTRKLFQSCPALESLILRICALDIHDITSDVLKELVITDCLQSQQIRIACPGLVSLWIDSDDPRRNFSLEKDVSRCRTFNSLKSFKMGGWDMTCEFDMVACFLGHSPNLQKLTLDLYAIQGNTEEEPSKEVSRDVFFCHEYLETVVICGKRAVAEKLVKILKRHVKTIGRIVIRDVGELLLSRFANYN